MSNSSSFTSLFPCLENLSAHLFLIVLFIVRYTYRNTYRTHSLHPYFQKVNKINAQKEQKINATAVHNIKVQCPYCTSVKLSDSDSTKSVNGFSRTRNIMFSDHYIHDLQCDYKPSTACSEIKMCYVISS